MLRPMTALLLLSSCATAWSQEPPGSAKPPVPDCSGPEYRQFDFWIGRWEVTQGGKLAGHNAITRELGDCALREQWQGAGGLAGTSLNFFDRADGHWHQLWVDGRGGVLRLRCGAPSEGEMLLESDPAAGGPRQRIRWTLREDGAVLQHWQQSADAGQTWTTAFLGEYRKLPDEHQRSR